MSKVNVNTIEPSTGTDITLGASGDTITVPSGATIVNSGTSTGFGATLSGSTNNTVVTVTGANAMIGEAKLLFDPAKLTIGNASEEDTSIVFDGHAQDYYIGLDDTDDDLKIGLGSAVGTTAHMVFDETGAITKPLQPAFCAYNVAAQNNIAGGATISFDTEVFDQNADYNNSTYTFTAPVTGRYCLIFAVRILNLTSNLEWVYVRTGTSNANYDTAIWDTRVFDADASYWHFNQTIFTDMDASDTSTITYQSVGTSATADIAGGRPQTQFSGYLVC